MYVLDTNIILYLFRNESSIIKKISTLDQSQISICSFVVAELFFGVNNSSSTIKNKLSYFYSEIVNKTKVYDFDTQSAIIFSKLKYIKKKTGQVTADLDIFIASICLANNLILVTNNTKHFENIPNLKLENWMDL